MTFLYYILQASVEKVFAQGSPWDIYCKALNENNTNCLNGKTYVLSLAIRTMDTVIYPLIGGIAVIGVLWASIKMTASFGNDQGKEEAKKIIGYAVVGIVLCVTGYAIVKWVCLFMQETTGVSGMCG